MKPRKHRLFSVLLVGLSIFLMPFSCDIDSFRSPVIDSSLNSGKIIASPAITITVKPTGTLILTPTVLTVTPAVTPTSEPTATPTIVPTAKPTATPTIVPTAKPTAIPTIVPTVTPTAIPTVTPTAIPVKDTHKEPTPTIARCYPTGTVSITPTISPTPIIYNSKGTAEEAPVFTGLSCIVAYADTGEVLLSYNPELRIYPASTIKLLTALVALDYADLSQSFTSKASVLYKIDEDVFTYGVKPDTTYTLDDWMKLMLVNSYGDAAATIADSVGGTIDDFLYLMNYKAKELGMVNTHVDNPIGLDVGNNYTATYTTSEDMMLLAQAAFGNSAIQNILSIKEYTVPASGNTVSLTVSNSNWFIARPTTYKSDYFTHIGGKTGNTDAAGSCLITAAYDSTGRKIIAAYFGGSLKSVLTNEIYSMFDYICKPTE